MGLEGAWFRGLCGIANVKVPIISEHVAVTVMTSILASVSLRAG